MTTYQIQTNQTIINLQINQGMSQMSKLMPQKNKAMHQKQPIKSFDSQISNVNNSNFELSSGSASNQNLRIWSDIASNKQKERQQVIEIVQEKTDNDLQEIPASSNKKIDQQKALIRKVNNDNQPLKQKLMDDELLSRQLWMAKKDLFDMILHCKQKQEIFNRNYSLKVQELNISKPQQIKLQLEAINFLNHQLRTTLQDGSIYHLVRVIDLLYKKFIMCPEMSKTYSKNQDIYKSEPVYGEEFYYMEEIKQEQKQKEDQMEISQENQFKRLLPGKSLADTNNCVSLIQPQSTSAYDDLDAMASNYIQNYRKISKPNVQMVDDNRNSQVSSSMGQNRNLSSNQHIIEGSYPAISPFNSSRALNPNRSLITQNAPFNPGQIRRVTNMNYQPVRTGYPDSSERSQKYEQERTVAKVFVKDGYGLNIIRNYLGPNIQGGTYNRAITSIIRQSYKKLEEFLSQNCKLKLNFMASADFTLIKTPLVHCRNILRPDDLKTFFKFIALTYDFGKMKASDSPTMDEALSLYNSILRGLQDRKVAKDRMSRGMATKQLSYKRY